MLYSSQNIKTISFIFISATLLFLASAIAADEKNLNIKVEAAINKGMDFLEAKQDTKGFWQNSARTKRIEITMWCLLAYLANGHTPNKGPYRQTVEKGLKWLVDNASQLTFKEAWHHENLVRNTELDAPLLLTFLSTLGKGTAKIPNEDLVIICERGVKNVLLRQRENKGETSLEDGFNVGGWGNIDNSYWCTLSLLYARQQGIQVPDIALEEALKFWKRHYIPQHSAYIGTSGNIGLNPFHVYTIRAVIVSSLLGESDTPEIKGGMETLKACDMGNPLWFWGMKGPSKHQHSNRTESGGHSRMLGEWYMAMHLGGAQPDEQKNARLIFQTQILKRQNEDGSFRHPGKESKWPKSLPYASDRWLQPGDGRAEILGNDGKFHKMRCRPLGYGLGWSEEMITARALHALSMPKKYLPVFNIWKKTPNK